MKLLLPLLCILFSTVWGSDSSSSRIGRINSKLQIAEVGLFERYVKLRAKDYVIRFAPISKKPSKNQLLTPTSPRPSFLKKTKKLRVNDVPDQYNQTPSPLMEDIESESVVFSKSIEKNLETRLQKFELDNPKQEKESWISQAELKMASRLRIKL